MVPDGRLLDFRRLDHLAAQSSALHRLDARAKVVVTLAFVVVAMSFDGHALTALLPLFAFPLVSVVGAGLPVGAVARPVAAVIPFALLVGLPNPWFDREVVAVFAGHAVTGGVVSMVSIVLRTVLAASAAILLLATTGMPGTCEALARLGVPRLFVVQLSFVHRYLAVLGEEGARMKLARELRGNGRALTMPVFGALAGSLLLRTWDRAERVYAAMQARGFDGSFPVRGRSRFGWREFLYVVGWSAFFVVARATDLTARLGAALLGLAP